MKIAVLVRQRTEEALRMALGLTLMDDKVDVYLTVCPPEPTSQNAMNLEMLREMKAGFYALSDVEGFSRVEADRFSEILLGYDRVIAY
ncbi:MAG: hypothetical protein M0Z59_07670 [Nitrospiraceae bacterium]|nr:hypothetical protein [Nitrospiraceae bacterium]